MKLPPAVAVAAVLLSTPSEAGDNRPLSAFSELHVDTAITVTLICGERPGVQIESDTPAIGDSYIDLRVVEGSEGQSVAKLHFRRDFDRQIHPDQMRLLLTTDRPLRQVGATTGARLTLPACALDSEQLTLKVETQARVEISGETRRLFLTVESGGTLNALGGGRGFVPKRVRLHAGRNVRVGLCHAGGIEILHQAEDARVLTGC
ncbi:head GIN domain-containing protein [Algihabitans albus]|uniref:hypothetical protein n=1 Tax=Algihabitans albus TaxID=2164067 RepID=UPI000E5D46FB|nr:hypothetical protein [Algihabitans albus]